MINTFNKPSPHLFSLIFVFLFTSGIIKTTESAISVDITALANQPIYAMQEGYGANVTAISTSIAVDQYGTAIGSANCLLPDAGDDVHWNSIFTFMNWSGLDWIRLLIEMNDYEPQRNVFTWNSPNFKRALKILDWAQANNVDVFLQQQDQATTWNTIPGQNPGNSAPYDLNAFADGFVNMVDYLVKQKKYTCIKLLNITNEPMNWWGWWKGGNIKDGYAAVRSKLNAKGIYIPLAGTEFFEGVKDGSGKIIDLTRYNHNWNECKPYLGAWENHDYAESQQGIISKRPISDPNYPVYWGEFAGHDNTNYDWDITVAKWFVGSANNGIDGFTRWSYLNQNNIDGIFSYIQTYDTQNNRLLDTYTPTKNLYWIDGIITRFTSKYPIVHAVRSTNAKVTPTLFKSPNGALSLVVINEDKTYDADCNITFQGLDGVKTLHRYQVTPSNVKDKTSGVSIVSTGTFTVSKTSGIISDLVTANSIYVYTTYNLAANDPGIVFDGLYKPVANESPIATNLTIIDNLHTSVIYSGTWGNNTSSGNLNSNARYTNVYGNYYQFTFTGSNFKLYGQQDNGSGMGSVYIDNVFAGYANNFAPVTRMQMLIYDSDELPFGTHTVKVVNEHKATISASGIYINIDAIGTDEAPPSNLIINPGFEANGIATQTPSVWNEWNNVSASYTETKTPRSGAYNLAHWSSSSYEVSTYQSVTNLPNGLYTIKAWVRSSGGQNTAVMNAQNYGGAEMRVNIPASNNYVQITLSNINVTNGQCSISFYSKASAHQWINVDDIEFVKQ
jgi:hypothetical protein